jgi:hypothetical protein
MYRQSLGRDEPEGVLIELAYGHAVLLGWLWVGSGLVLFGYIDTTYIRELFFSFVALRFFAGGCEEPAVYQTYQTRL